LDKEWISLYEERKHLYRQIPDEQDTLDMQWRHLTITEEQETECYCFLAFNTYQHTTT
jgi:hypothetical protein